MKKLLYIFCISFCMNIYSQKIERGIITYQKSKTKIIYKEIPKSNPNYEHFKEIEEKINEALKQIEFTLKFKGEESNFEVVKSLLLETDKYARMGIIPYGDYKYYTSKDQNLSEVEALGHFFLVSQGKFEWKLLNETKKIGNYICHKAETFMKMQYRGKIKNYPITAWYCPQINVPFGPIFISGLPGLILETEMGNTRYTAIKIQLNPKEKIKIEKLTKGKKITQEELHAMFDRAMGDFKKEHKIK